MRQQGSIEHLPTCAFPCARAEGRHGPAPTPSMTPYCPWHKGRIFRLVLEALGDLPHLPLTADLFTTPQGNSHWKPDPSHHAVWACVGPRLCLMPSAPSLSSLKNWLKFHLLPRPELALCPLPGQNPSPPHPLLGVLPKWGAPLWSQHPLCD